MIHAWICAAMMPDTQTAYTTRILPFNQWEEKLRGTELELLAPKLDPLHTRVIVVEKDGEIVGCWAVARLVHLEGLWVAPHHRKKAAVGLRLWRAAQAQVKALGSSWAFTGAATEEVRAMLEKVGADKVPMDTYVVPIKE